MSTTTLKFGSFFPRGGQAAISRNSRRTRFAGGSGAPDGSWNAKQLRLDSGGKFRPRRLPSARIDITPVSVQNTHVVIIGAGFAGLNAARALKNSDALITVIDRRNHHLFQPLLYQVATAALSAGDIAYPIRSIFKRQRNIRVLLAEAVGIDAERRTVRLADGEIKYNYLVLAPGARHAYFGHDEWEKLAPGLKNIEDAVEIRRRILVAFEKAERVKDRARRRELLTFVVVGGGPTGVELAGAIAEIAHRVLIDDFRAIDPSHTRVVLVEAGPRILPSFPEELSAKAEQSLVHLGVEVWKGTPVSRIDEHCVEINRHRIETATTLWAAGVQASPLARSLGVELDRAGRVAVNPDLSVPGYPEIFVAGDLALFTHQGGKPLPGVAPVAMQQGRHAAASIERLREGQGTEPFHFHYRGNLATIGRAAAVADFGKIRLGGHFAWLLWLFVHVMYLVGFRNRVAVIINWAWAYFRSHRAARIIFGDMDTISPGWRQPAPESEKVTPVEAGRR